MKRFLFFISMVALFSCKKEFVESSKLSNIQIPSNDSSINHPQHAAYSELIEKYRKRGLPGISLLVRNSAGTWVGATGKSDLENNIAFTPGQVSKVASITKFIIGVLAFKMMEDSTNSGLRYSDLYQPVSKWLPDKVVSKLPNGNLITLGDCMKHETGIPDLISQDAFYLAITNEPNKKWEPEELLSFVYEMDPEFVPRDTAVYSNTNTILVSMILSAAGGKHTNSLLHQYLFSPLNMQNTYYQPHDPLPNTVAQGYFDLYNNNKLVNVSNLITGSGNGYGGIYSNLFDLYTFIDALLLKKNLLSEKSLNLMQTWGKADPPNRYGYGIMQKFIERGIDAGIGHSGRDLGYTANLFYFPNKDVLHIFFINYGTDSKSNLREVFNEFQEELLDLTLK